MNWKWLLLVVCAMNVGILSSFGDEVEEKLVDPFAHIVEDDEELVDPFAGMSGADNEQDAGHKTNTDCSQAEEDALAGDLDKATEMVALDEVHTTPDMRTVFARSESRRSDDMMMLVTFLVLGSFLLYHKVARKYHLLLLGAALFYFGFFRHGCICSVGAVGSVAISLSDSTVTISKEALFFFLVPLVFAFFFGRVFCGSACPIGAVQELISFKAFKVPKKLDKVLQLFKYFVLGYALIEGVNIPICKFDPFVTLFHFRGSTVRWIWLGVALVMSTLIVRPFCRWVCPYGILLGLLSKFAFKKRDIVKDECVMCQKCQKVCPVNCMQPPKVTSSQCVACGRCSLICPKDAIE